MKKLTLVAIPLAVGGRRGDFFSLNSILDDENGNNSNISQLKDCQ